MIGNCKNCGHRIVRDKYGTWWHFWSYGESSSALRCQHCMCKNPEPA